MIGPKWINSYGFVCANEMELNDPFGPANGWLNTGLTVACKMYAPDFTSIYLSCVGNKYPLFYRSPTRKHLDDQEAADDYFGMFVMIDTPVALSLLRWGENHGWHFDVQSPEREDIRYRFDRFISFVPLLRLKAGEMLSLIDHVAITATILWDSFHTLYADPNKKAFCRISVVRDRCWHFTLASRLWFYMIKKRYGTVGRSWAASLADGHPLSEYDTNE